MAWASAEGTQEMVKGEPGVRDEEGSGEGWPVSGPQDGSGVGGGRDVQEKKAQVWTHGLLMVCFHDSNAD